MFNANWTPTRARPRSMVLRSRPTVRNLVPYELDRPFDLVFAPEGLRCAINVPLTEVSSNDGQVRHSRSTKAYAAAPTTAI
jgi:hypothetical protein